MFRASPTDRGAQKALEAGGALLDGVVGDIAFRQRFLKFSNLCFGEARVVAESQYLQFSQSF